MIEFYASLTPSAQKVWLMLEELGLEYDTHLVNAWKGEQHSEAFGRLNANRKIPVIVDPNGPDGAPYTVFESGAILIYLAETHGQFLAKNGCERYETLKWLMIQMSGQGPMFGQFIHFKRYAPSGNNYSVDRYTSECARIYEVLNARLGEVEFFSGGAYSIVDMAMFPWIRAIARACADQPGFYTIDNDRFPNLWRWFGQINARPAVARALAIIDAIPSTQSTASKDDHNRFFLRDNYARK